MDLLSIHLFAFSAEFVSGTALGTSNYNSARTRVRCIRLAGQHDCLVVVFKVALAARETPPGSRAAVALNPRNGFSVVFLIVSRENFSFVVGDRPGVLFLNSPVLKLWEL